MSTTPRNPRATRKVEAWWFLLNKSGEPAWLSRKNSAGRAIVERTGSRYLKLVPYDAKAEAVVRAARKAVASHKRVSWGLRELEALHRAVSRLERSRAKGRKAK